MNIKTAYEVRNNILNYMKNNLSKIEGSYNFDIASAVAEELGNSYIEIDDLQKELFPWTCTKEPYLSYHLMCYGLTRINNTKATGKITIRGKNTSLVPINTVVVSRVGIRYKTLENAVIGNSEEVIVGIEAIEAGITGNCAVGDITGFEVVRPEIYSVTNKEPVTGGAPIETVESAKERMKKKASVPSHSGNKNNYIEWLKELGGVGNIAVFGPSDNVGVPAGDVHIYFADYKGEIPNGEQIAQVKNYINTTNKRPVGCNLVVKAFNPLTTNLTFSEVTVKKGSISKEKWIEELKAKVQLGYATKDFLVADTVPYAKIGNIALNIKGTILYNDFKINGTTSNISIAYNQTPIIGNVTITSFKEVS